MLFRSAVAKTRCVRLLQYHLTADLSITFDMKNMDIQIEEILEEISALDGVVNVEIIALE